MIAPRPPFRVRKRMTICIAIRAKNGIVLAADAEESDAEHKIGVQKIVPWVGRIKNFSPQSAWVLAGAGDSGYLECFADVVHRRFDSEGDSADLVESFEDELRDFHNKHVFPLSKMDEPPWFDFLVGVYEQGAVEIRVTSKSACRLSLTHAAIGFGAGFAMSLINQFADISDDLSEAEVIAAYVIRMTKERMRYCGKYTMITSLRATQNPDPFMPIFPVPYEKIKAWENLFETKWHHRQREVIRDLAHDAARSSG